MHTVFAQYMPAIVARLGGLNNQEVVDTVVFGPHSSSLIASDITWQKPSRSGKKSGVLAQNHGANGQKRTFLL